MSPRAPFPLWVLDKWELRSTYIGQGELIAGPLVATYFADLLRSRKALWFVDNTSAASALIKHASPTADNSPMALLTGLCLAALNSAAWYEYVDTKQNPADWPSRGGLENPEVRKRLDSGAWVSRSLGYVDWNAMLKLDFHAAWERMTALG